jgi:peptide/nickel transport system ATP-binding protein
LRFTDTRGGAPLLEIQRLRKEYTTGGVFSKSAKLVAVQGITFTIESGEAVALVGESGSGKSTIARLLLRLIKPDGGRILLRGEDVLGSQPRRASLDYRGKVQMVFQDPFGSLNPVHTVSHHLARPLVRHRRAEMSEVEARSVELLKTVGLEPPEDFLHRHPYELSGGQRQRVAIARALAVDPDLLVADEPTSMLDVSIRMGILNLLAELKKERKLAILLITHDLASARHLADRFLVLYRGRVVEEGPSRQLVEDPLHPYTRSLLASAFEFGDWASKKRPSGRSGYAELESGCPYSVHCSDVMEECRSVDPESRALAGRSVRCHLYPETTQAAGSDP